MSKSVAEFTVDSLIRNGFDPLYCLPGIQNDVFFDALFHRTSELKPLHTRHEQGAAYMAIGAAIATGRPQVFCTVPGPGFLNTTAALATAYAINAPVLALVGQIPSGAVGKGLGLLHEIPDQFGILRSLTKSAYQVTSENDLVHMLQSAFHDLNSGRPGPVGLEIPVDLWPKIVPDDSIQSAYPTANGSEELAFTLLDEASKIIENSRAPMIVVGGGALDASEEVKHLAETISAPVLAYRNGRGVMPSDHPLSISMPIGHDLWPNVDVVIGLGTRLQSQIMPWGRDGKLKVIHIDIDPAQLSGNPKTDVAIEADLRDALPVILAHLVRSEPKRDDWIDKIAVTRKRYEQRYLAELAPQMAWLNAIRKALPRDGIFVDELTQTGYVSRFAFPVYEPRTFLSSGYQGTLGYGIATALGAAHARRDVPVVSICGDGGALYTITELATAALHNIPLTVIVFNDNMFGNIRRFQDDHYGGRHIACDLDSPDFVQLAGSFGVDSTRALTPDELQRKLSLAFKSNGPTLIEVPVNEMPSPWEYILMQKNRGA